GEVVARRVRLLWVETRNHEAIELGIAALERLGVSVPREPALARAIVSLIRAWQWVKGLDRAAIEALPRCEDQRDAVIVDVIASIKYTSFATHHSLFLLLSGLHVVLAEQLGYHPTTPSAIGDLSLGVSGRLDKVEDAAQILELGRELAASEPTATTEVRVLSVGGAMALHRSRPFAEIVALLDGGYQRALEVGEFGPASFIAGFGADMQLEIGTHLRVLGRRCRRIARDIGRWCPNQMRVEVWLLRGLCLALLGPEAETREAIADGEVWDLDPDRIVENGGSTTNVRVGYIFRTLVALLFDDSATALELCVRHLEDAEQVVFNTWYVARACVLTCASYYIELRSGASPGPEAKAVVARSLRTLERWAADGPANYGHYLDFVLGLRDAIEGHAERSARLLDRAWQHARQRGCRWIEALAATQLADLLELTGMCSLVDGARTRAWDAYAAWGAEAKLEQLRAAH